MWPAVQLSRPELRNFCLFHLCYMVDFNAYFWQNCGRSVEKGAAGSHSLIRNSFSLFCLLFSFPVNLWLSHTHGCVLPLLTFKTIISWGQVLAVPLVDIRSVALSGGSKSIMNKDSPSEKM